MNTVIDLFGDPIEAPRKNALRRKFTVPPFTDLNAREGWWQDRKRWWIGLGLAPEIGRQRIGGLGAKVDNIEANIPNFYVRLRKGESRANILTEYTRSQLPASGVSLFDPTLCELAYRWFTREGDQVLDPFAGGSVRGIVACKLARRYWGCDLRAEQIDANEQQAREICPEAPPAWCCGDALDEVPKAPQADFIFSCPPYGDLERYSDDPRDLSTMEYHTFIANLKRIILRCWERLRDNRFACFVVGEFRDKQGYYRNFVGDTVEAFRAAGFRYYNEAILVTAVGSLPIRITKQFQASRKLGKTHQNVLVFVKGEGKAAARRLVV